MNQIKLSRTALHQSQRHLLPPGLLVVVANVLPSHRDIPRRSSRIPALVPLEHHSSVASLQHNAGNTCMGVVVFAKWTFHNLSPCLEVIVPDVWIRLVNCDNDSYTVFDFICIDNVNCFFSTCPISRALEWGVSFDDRAANYHVLYLFFRDAPLVHAFYGVLSVD